ncbi:hypothetical protein J0X19_22850 [Hymenobacter sp. BT186]|uniref:Uncharacterized protein n=1 Tax=Hymenobacter telluris TaxID=2816474 RepID=A0A939F1V8_9BACT|nr:hypothetical protein [Hymenobacter telluris]MBO0360817.1 hypothetical protein [Hymenobacter telluris]MBW3376846.1 hypothetical protein [Hymenobacter norwichensis]
MVLLTPTDSSTSPSALQTFRWEPVAGARQYRIQIAAPSFERPTTFFLDSLTSRPSFATSLVPGSYHWRVQALNSAYETLFTTRSFRVDTTGSLSNQGISLLQPANSSVTNRTLVTLAWVPLAVAERYLLTLQPNPRTATGSLDTLLTGAARASVQLRLPGRSQIYRWKLTALNATSLRESATQSFEVDVTAPGMPSLATPLNGELFSNLPLTLSWSRGGTDVAADSLFVYGADQTTFVSSFPRAAATAGFTFPAASTLLVPGTYFWAVRSVDRAGNAGPRTGKRSFIVQ